MQLVNARRVRTIFFQWKDEYLTHIDELDAQHQKLVALINYLYADLLQHQNDEQKRGVINKVLAELVAYSRYHFEAEERLMREYEYPGYEQHREEHERFKQRVAVFMQEQAADSPVLPFPLVVFLKEWLTSHVLITDKPYGPYLVDRIKK